MKFIVETEEGTVELDQNLVTNMLTESVMKQEKKDHAELSKALLKYLELNEVLSETSLMQLALISFSMGYFYRIFLNKNDVTIREDNEASSSINSEESSS